MPESVSGGDDWVSVAQAARLLGLRLHTVRALVNKGILPAELTLPSPRPKSRRRAIRIRRQDLAVLIERAKVQPGELTHLHSQARGPDR